MTEEKKDTDVPDPELLPPRDVLSLINPDPSSYTSLLGTTPTDTSGTSDAATTTVGDATHLASEHIPPSDAPATTSDQPQTVPVESTETSSSST